MRDYEKRITAAFLKNCSPDAAYNWLHERAKALAEEGANGRRNWDAQSEHRVLEYVLLRRRHPLIDVGLAQHGRTGHVLRVVFGRGNAGVRCAVLANRFLFKSDFLSEGPVVDLGPLLKHGNRRELEALALNPHLPDSFYEDLIKRTAAFANVDDRTYTSMLYRLGDNPRLSASYDDTFLDGYSDYKFHSVLTAAWELTATAPNTKDWAAILSHLLHKAKPPVGFKDVMNVIQRWQIDTPRRDDDSYYFPGYGFNLRSRLADLLEPDDTLLNSPDFALRQSFYRRFSPRTYKDWPDFLQRDGEEFVQEAMQNTELWRIPEERERLHKVAWASPDPRSDMMMPNAFRAREKWYRKEHPEWFHQEEDEYSNDSSAVVRRMEQLLKSIAEQLDSMSSQETPKRRWWQ